MKVQPNRNLKVMGSPEKSDIYDVGAGQHLELDYASLEPSRQGKLSILSRQESSLFTLTFGMVAALAVFSELRRDGTAQFW